jgi:hypothetical protein
MWFRRPVCYNTQVRRESVISAGIDRLVWTKHGQDNRRGQKRRPKFGPADPTEKKRPIQSYETSKQKETKTDNFWKQWQQSKNVFEGFPAAADVENAKRFGCGEETRRYRPLDSAA